MSNIEFETVGDAKLLEKPKYAILLSHQSRQPTPGDWWIHATSAAAKWAASSNLVAVAGGGMLHLDYARWACHSYGPTIYVDVGDVKKGKSLFQSAVSEPWCDLRISMPCPISLPDSQAMQRRDMLIASMADVLIVVAVRKGGVMERLGLEALKKGKEVHAIEPPKSDKDTAGNLSLLKAGAKRFDLEIKLPALLKSETPWPNREIEPMKNGGDYLWHFTRRRDGPWPGQSWESHFDDLLRGKEWAAHTALDTLKRMLGEERVRASSHLIRGGHEVVCFSGADPVELMRKRTFRNALARWEFEPYAVGLKRSVAERLGLRKVAFGSASDFAKISDDEKYLFQKIQTGKAKWSDDEEWRALGDFALTGLHPSEGAALVPSDAEAGALSGVSRFPIYRLDVE